MNVHNNAMLLLEKIYEVCTTSGAYEVDRQSYSSLSAKDKHEIPLLIEHLKSMNLIDNFAPCVGKPISVKITPKGICTIEKIPEAVTTTNNIVYGNNYGITGNHAVGNTISNDASFEEIKNLIARTVNSRRDQQELIEVLKPLYDRIKIGAPIKKGMLSKVADKLQAYQPLLASIVSSLLTYLTGK